MIGLLFLALYFGYFLIAVIAVKTAMAWSRKRGDRPWIAGTFVGLAFYMGLFWDHIPTLVLFKYHCNQDAGFHVYQTVDEWTRQNPDAAASLTKLNAAQSRVKGSRGFLLNERFKVDIDFGTPVTLSIKRKTERIVDRTTNRVVAEYVDYSSGSMSLLRGITSITHLKQWLSASTCGDSIRDSATKKLGAYVNSVWELGETK